MRTDERTKGWLLAIIVGSFAFSFGLTFWKESAAYKERLMSPEITLARTPPPNAAMRLGSSLEQWGQQRFPVSADQRGVITTAWSSVGVGLGLLAISGVLPALVWGALCLLKGRRPFPFGAWVMITVFCAWAEWYDAVSALRP